MDHAAILHAPFGALGVRIEGAHVVNLEFLPPGIAAVSSSNPLIRKLSNELDAYFADPEYRFSVPLSPVGSSFRLRVWQALMDIPAGQTRSYGEIAQQLDSAPRAVGQAVGDNPIPIIIPCHRVIAANGGLGGFMHSRTGFSQDIKRWLLRHEHAL